MIVATETAARPSARERLLAAADELFYAEGVQTVGIDRIIEHAGVAKASLYNTFGSKEELVRAYLANRRDRSTGRISRAIEGVQGPRAKLLAIFDAQAELAASPGYRGCAFVAASAEARAGGCVEQATDDYRAWIRALFLDLAEQAGADDPAALGSQLNLLYDGATLSARMDRDPTAPITAKAAATALLDAAIKPSGRRS
ncbi:MAG: TetR/AcrR family transcriptional regulator [Jatrophihabitantaceae bacterium]